VKFSISQRACAEFLGTVFLVTAVVGSGIMGERLSNGNVAIALLANSIATGAALVTLILTFGPISGAHFNPVVTLANAVSSRLARADTLPYILAQFAGGFAGTVNSHFMFGLPAITYSRHARSGPAQFYAEIVATFGLIAVISTCARGRRRIYCRGLLVYIIHFVCESGSHFSAMFYRQFCGNPAARCSWICSGRNFRCGGRLLFVSLVDCAPNQCRKWRIAVNTMAMPRRSAAAMTSVSRTDPPG
jgi:glycerol uptake facilitator-like aquaporin